MTENEALTLFESDPQVGYREAAAALRNSHEAAQRLAKAGNDLSIAFALVPVDWNCKWAGETASKAVEADKKFRAALAEWEAANG